MFTNWGYPYPLLAGYQGDLGVVTDRAVANLGPRYVCELTRGWHLGTTRMDVPLTKDGVSRGGNIH
jgi:hypothetical protein